MKIKKPLTLHQKYFNEFQNYFHNADEKLVSYSYICLLYTSDAADE